MVENPSERPYCAIGGNITKRVWAPLGEKDYSSYISQIPKNVDGVYVDYGTPNQRRLDRITAAGSASGSSGDRAALGDGSYRGFLRSPDETLGSYPPIRIVLNAVHDQNGAMCGRAEGGTVVPTDCRDDRSNAYVFDIAPSPANRSEACARRADLVTQRGSNLLCWQRIVAVQ